MTITHLSTHAETCARCAHDHAACAVAKGRARIERGVTGLAAHPLPAACGCTECDTVMRALAIVRGKGPKP